MSGIRESNPCLHLGRVTYYHYTNPAIAAGTVFIIAYCDAIMQEGWGGILLGIGNFAWYDVSRYSAISMYKGNRNKLTFFVAGGALVVFLVFFFVVPLFISSKTPLPQKFVNARGAAALISSDIVRLTSETNNAIHAVDTLDFSKEKDRALGLINQAKETNKEAYGKAFTLSQELQKLAESLENIQSPESRRIAYEAVATELSLVSEFITYTQNLQTFLDAVGALVITNTDGNKTAVNQSLLAVNEKTRLINELNGRFNLKMEEFEKTL